MEGGIFLQEWLDEKECLEGQSELKEKDSLRKEEGNE